MALGDGTTELDGPTRFVGGDAEAEMWLQAFEEADLPIAEEIQDAEES